MLFLWQIYLDNVDPFTKVVHLSAVSKLVRELRGGYQALTPNLEALVLAIAFAAVMSLEDQEVSKVFSPCDTAKCPASGAPELRH